MTTTTNLQVTLTATLQNTLNAGGAAAYAVYFYPTAADQTFITLFTGDTSAATVTTPLTVDIPLTENFASGKVYFVIQSPVDGTLAPLDTVLTAENDLNWNQAQTSNFRYDSFEVNLENSPFDAGNLTEVEGFGLPMSVGVTFQDGTSASIGTNLSGQAIFDAIAKMGSGGQTTVFGYDNAGSTGLTGDRAALSPAQAVGIGSSAFSPSDWQPYIDWLKETDPATKKPHADAIAFSGFFEGTKDANFVFHNSGFYSYSLSWDSTNQVFWLSPTVEDGKSSSNSQILGNIAILPEQLASSIYATNSYYEVYESKSDYGTSPYAIFQNEYNGSKTDIYTGSNNQWGDILKQFFTGFTAGYFGVEGKSPSGDTVNLNQNWNWDPTYAFGENLVSGQSPTFYDHYAKLFFENSNSYGSGYSDQLMSAYVVGNPLLTMYDPALNGNVDTINLTIFDDSETPTGYTAPVIANYIAAPSGYAIPTYSSASAANIGMDFTLGASILDEGDAKITFEFQSGTQADPKWETVSLTKPKDASLWQLWNIVQNTDGTYSLESAGVSQPAGSILLNHVPVAESGVSWYKITVSDKNGGSAKTFNLYTTTVDGQFENPAYSGQVTSLAIDGLAKVSGPGGASPAQYTETFTIDFMTGVFNTIEPDLIVPTQSTLVPDVVVVGTLTGSSTSPTPSNNALAALAGQSGAADSSVSTGEGTLAFGWAAFNPVIAGDDTAMSAYTNKVDPGTVAHVAIAGSGQVATGMGDLDGQWLTSSVQLGNGTYTLNMQQFAASDKAFAHPLTQLGASLTLHVNLTDLDLAVAGGGQGIMLVDDGSGTSGNWVRLDTASGTLPLGVTLVAYAVNAAGELVSRDGLSCGAAVSLSDAALGYVGTVSSDAGGVLLSGGQSVFLANGLELRFATIAHSGAVDMAAPVAVSAQGEGALAIEVAGLHLSAEVGNTLSDAASLAGNQRIYDTPWVYLKQGDAVSLEITGSCGGTNTLGFVRLDVDAQTGDWSVDGIAYGDTPQFRAAVLASLDKGFSFTGGGDFTTGANWTVQGSEGYYAPVLLSQSGEVFVIGTANSDGLSHVRTFGENTFGFEDLAAGQGSDFDYNDMVLRLTPEEGFLL